MMHPCGDLVRSGPDGVDVYAEEMALLEERGIQWLEVATLYCACGTVIGAFIAFGRVLKPITIYGFTDEGGSG